MNRKDLQNLANARIKEAKVLLDAGKFSGSYHLAGLAIECALKACISKQTKKYDFPDKKFAADCFEHDPTKLMKLARLDQRIDTDAKASPALGVNWGIVKNWGVESRYTQKTKQEAEDLYSAIHRQKTGVLRWLRQHW